MGWYNNLTKGMSPTTKGITGIALVVAGAGAGFLIYNAIKKRADEKRASQAAQQASGETAALISQGIQPSYSDSQYSNFVHILTEAMNGCGTDEDSIYAIFDHMANEVDIRKLITAFGVQYYQPCAASQPLSYLRWQWDDQAYGGDLATWLGYDLSTDEISHINSILSSKGINYRF